jgi:hypothetical protein
MRYLTILILLITPASGIAALKVENSKRINALRLEADDLLHQAEKLVH